MLTYLIDPVLCAWYLAIVFVMFLHLPVPKYEGPSEVIALTPAAFRKRVLEDSGAFSSRRSPYDRVGVVNAVPQVLYLPASLSAQGPSVSIPAYDTFQLHLTPFDSAPTSL